MTTAATNGMQQTSRFSASSPIAIGLPWSSYRSDRNAKIAPELAETNIASTAKGNSGLGTHAKAMTVASAVSRVRRRMGVASSNCRQKLGDTCL